ncbi:hypothetical protein [Mesorhizobium sp. dw_380]|uniref:hypothetical protein n=1 Tax=Mesorhizobium sp. dw_380 TaxID=2812001 RepID=UPI001BDE6863|nr:hypothetical protein [Mesorhizobium sp. dw_380]
METTTLIAWLARVGMLPAAAALIIAALPARADETVGVTLADKGMQSMRMDLSTEQVKAGNVTFNVTNTSRALAHEFVVVRSDKPIETLLYNEPEKEVEESALEVVSEIDDSIPGSPARLR